MHPIAFYKSARTRIRKFRALFKTLPEHGITLNNWYVQRITKQLGNGEEYCGTIGCVGGYLAHSHLMKEFQIKNPELNIDDAMGAFCGLTTKHADRFHLFASRRTRKPEKVEALERLDKLVNYHTKKIATLTERARTNAVS